MNRLDCSFRDVCSGFVFSDSGVFFRLIKKKYLSSYNMLMSSGLYEELTQKEYIVTHEEVESLKNGELIIKPLQLSNITYPYEWSFSQLKDAAILTLKIQKVALKYGMCLKDASAYNIQFFNGKPIFIDTASFSEYRDGSPWVAYGQFCKHFLFPLLLMKYVDIDLIQLLKSNIDGIPVSIADHLLPCWTKFFPSVFFHVKLHRLYQKKFGSSGRGLHKSRVSLAQTTNINIALQDLVSGLECPKLNTEWKEYYTFTNYDKQAFKHKSALVRNAITLIKPKTLWDFGANNGLFTRIAANMGVDCLAFDIDPLACEANYVRVKNEKEKKILPVLFDLCNPSPDIGWNNAERQSILKRHKPDVIMALAFVHHLAISNNIPLAMISRYFAGLSEHLIIEFVPKEDSQVQKMLCMREDIFDEYSESFFDSAFTKDFNILSKQKVEDSSRILYVMKRIR